MFKIFGGKTCLDAAEQLKDHLHNLVVFSICSDERLPHGLEEYLCTNKDIQNILIVGDFLTVPPSREESPASYEAIRLALINSRMNRINVGWMNSAYTQTNLLQNTKWDVFLSPQNMKNRVKDLSLTIDVEKICREERAAYLHICELLKFPVYVGVEQGRIVTVDFTDNLLYPRGLTNNLSTGQMQELWNLTFKLHHLQSINARFNHLKFLPDFSSLLKLKKIDLRGNSGLKFHQLQTIEQLEFLNISACSLTELPSVLNSLRNLKTLLAYKNHISYLSNIEFPKSIERISLYRNLLNNETIDLRHCDNLKEINLGANPIVNLTLMVSPIIQALQLRLRYIKSKIKILPDNVGVYYVRED